VYIRISLKKKFSSAKKGKKKKRIRNFNILAFTHSATTTYKLCSAIRKSKHYCAQILALSFRIWSITLVFIIKVYIKALYLLKKITYATSVTAQIIF
jgi:hypothetical protein